MRVITGTARGRRLETLPGEETRPTAERVKEGLFSAIQFDIEGRRAVDLFAGSGQLGIEALSRGAAGCIFIDRNAEAAEVIRRNLKAAGLYASAHVLTTDAMLFLERGRERFDLAFLDPPYASGGWKPSEKNRTTFQKYSSMDPKNALPDFDGDNRDQRSWTRWMAEWLSDARKACKPGAPVCLFIDWRQLPAMTLALQWAGWTWRGVAVWDKVASRPQKGRFRQQSEYIVWGSNGKMPLERNVGCLPGVFRYPNPQNRIHVTEKPLQLMRDVVQICEPGGRILDPFAGAGTTVLAAVQEGYEAVGIEMSDAYFRRSTERLKTALESEVNQN